MLINPFPFRNSKPTPAGFHKEHTQSTVYIDTCSKWISDNFIAQCLTKISCRHWAGSKSALRVKSIHHLQGREQRNSPSVQKRCVGQSQKAPFIFLHSRPFAFDDRDGLNHSALTSWDRFHVAPCRYFSCSLQTRGLALRESGLGWDMRVLRRQREVHILESKCEAEDK